MVAADATEDASASSSSSPVVADLGCGHGMLALGLAASGRVTKVIAVDVSPDEVEVANAKAAQANETIVQASASGDGIELPCVSPLPIDVRLGDGAEALVAGDGVDVVCVAGVGGRTMVKMLKAAGLHQRLRHARNRDDDDDDDACASVTRLVLNPPATDIPEVRKWLMETDAWTVCDERLQVENGQMHAVLAATRRRAASGHTPRVEVPVQVDKEPPDDTTWGGSGSWSGGGGDFQKVADVHVGPVLRVAKPKILGLFLRNRVEYFEARRRGALETLRRARTEEARSPAVECSLALSSEDEDAVSFLLEVRARRVAAEAEVERLSKIVGVMSTVLGEVNMKALDEAGFGGTLDLPQAR
jgi:tRNA A22 N-methylase